MRLAAALTFLLALCPLGSTATLIVPTNYPTIQSAINASGFLDVVLVLPGTYFENIDFKGHAVMVQSQGGPDVTTIDGQQLGSVVTFGSGAGVYCGIHGFLITNGLADRGSGIVCLGASPSIRNNRIEHNGNFFWSSQNRYGGGIYCDGFGFPTIADNIIRDNRVATTTSATTAAYGGGIYVEKSKPSILRNTISENYASTKGGGLFCADKSQAVVADNDFIGNESNYQSYAVGGAIYAEDSVLDILRNRFIANEARIYGGGICLDNCNFTDIIGNLFFDNLAKNPSSAGGGAIHAGGSDDIIVADNVLGNNLVTTSSPSAIGRGGGFNGTGCHRATFRNNIIYGNSARQGAGVHLATSSEARFVNNTFAANTWGTGGKGGGLTMQGCSLAVISNCLFWANQAPLGPSISLTSVNVDIEYTDLELGISSVHMGTGASVNWGASILAVDPLFVNAAQDDYHLLYGSPCRDTGNGLAVGLPTSDFEGDSRNVGAAPDIGADEFARHLYLTGDATPGSAVQLKFVGSPGTTPVALAVGPARLGSGIPGAYGDWYLGSPYIIVAGLGPIPADGVYVVSGILPASIAAPYTIYAQAFVGLQLTNLCTIDVQ